MKKFYSIQRHNRTRLFFSLFFSILLFPHPPVLASSKINTFKSNRDTAGRKNVKTITSRTKCKTFNTEWKENDTITNSCVCCIIKNTPKNITKLNDSKATEISTICKDQKKYCQKYKPSDPDIKIDQEYIKKIIKNNASMQYILIDNYSSLNKLNLTEKGVQEILTSLQNSEETPDDLKNKLAEKTFLIKNLGGTAGGSQTTQLFFIEAKSTNASPSDFYILKGMKKPFEEVKNLEIIRKSNLKKYFLDNTQNLPPRPAIAMDAHNIMYAPPKGETQYISLINAAKWTSIKSIIEDYLKERGMTKIGMTNQEHTTKALKALGKAISTIHRENQVDPTKFMEKTYIHGDFHPDNVFYDFNNDRITLIDNESFAHSISLGSEGPDKRQDPTIDIMKFYGTITASFNSIHNYLSKAKGPQGPGLESFYEDVIQPFITGYIEAYPQDQRQAVFDKIKKVMSTQGALKTFEKNKISTLNPLKLKESQEKYMPLLFKRVASLLKLADVPLQKATIPSTVGAIAKGAVTQGIKTKNMAIMKTKDTVQNIAKTAKKKVPIPTLKENNQ